MRLADTARAYAAGDLSDRVLPSGPVEIAALGATFNAMAAAIERQMADLQDAQRREREAGARALAELRRLHSEFIAVAAHELRTPVAGAKSYAELLLREDADLSPAVRRQALQRLDAVCERLARLVRSLLGASRIQAGRLEVQRAPVDLAALAARVVDDFSGYAPGHDVRIELPDHVPGTALVALGDADRVEDVLVNLLSNAAKYAPGGSAIVVRVRRLADAIETDVEDQGPGIPPAEQEAVFERFRRGEGAAGQAGIGLGLYIAQAYTQAMDGAIGVRSVPGQGATFWFRLPAADAAGPDQDLAAPRSRSGAVRAEPAKRAKHARAGTTRRRSAGVPVP
jgi:signal transduction histidine kinase